MPAGPSRDQLRGILLTSEAGVAARFAGPREPPEVSRVGPRCRSRLSRDSSGRPHRSAPSVVGIVNTLPVTIISDGRDLVISRRAAPLCGAAQKAIKAFASL